MKKSPKERIKALPIFLKSETMKKYGISFIAIILYMLIICVRDEYGWTYPYFICYFIRNLLYSFANYIVKETNHYVTNLSYKINKGS